MVELTQAQLDSLQPQAPQALTPAQMASLGLPSGPQQGNRRGEFESVGDYRQRLTLAQQAGDVVPNRASAQMNAQAEADMGPQTNILEQGLNGVNEGLGGLLGLPVDLVAGGINLGVSGINAATGSDIPKITDPLLGSNHNRQMLRDLGLITPEEPQTAAQRYTRSIGQEAGASVVPAAGAAARMQMAAPMARRMLGLEAASTVGAGVGAQVARDVAPDNPAAEIIASMVGGGAPIAGARAVTSGPSAPSIDDLRREQQAAYGRVEESGARLSPETNDAIRNIIQGRVAQEGVPEFLPTPVRSIASRADALPNDAQVTDIEDLRRIIGNDVAGNADPQTRRIGVDLKNGLDEHMRGLQPHDISTGNPGSVFSDLQRGRELTQRIARSDGLMGDTGAVTRAERRAATSGTGGNEVNAIRQNIRSILDRPAQRRQYSDDQIEAMTNIVEGTPTTNTLRLLGRMSPSSGALSMMANSGAIGGGIATGNPLLAAPAFVGLASQGAAETLTHRQVQRLDELIRNGAPLDPSRMTEAQQASLFSLGVSQSRERE